MRFVLSALALVLAQGAWAEEITVFAAASLKGPLDEVAQAFSAATGHQATISYGGSAALAKQIIEAAPADVFLSASSAWMDKLEEAGLIKPDTRHDLLGNQLVLVAYDPKAAPVTLEPGTDLVGLLQGGKLAMALVDSVPAGQYGKEALTSLGLWDAVAPHVAQAEDVRAALRLVTTGEAAMGVVYATDAKGQAVQVVATFPAQSHGPITYPAAVMAASERPAAEAFAQFLQGPQADAIFAQAGFDVLP